MSVTAALSSPKDLKLPIEGMTVLCVEKTLKARLVDCRNGADRPDCPIIDTLEKMRPLRGGS
ncbi:MAG: hypothetical protein AB7F38_01740 [Piscinibacter sp.]|jgi:hypothetical protein